MHPITILQLALLAACQVVAAPAEPASQAYVIKTLLEKRADPAPVSCGPPEDQRAWPLQSVQNSYNALVANAPKSTQDKPRAGNRYYPRRFGNPTPSDPTVVTALDAIPECKTGQANKGYTEFPLTDPVFTGGLRIRKALTVYWPSRAHRLQMARLPTRIAWLSRIGVTLHQEMGRLILV